MSGNANGSSISHHVDSWRAGPVCEFGRALTTINAIGWLLRAPSARTAAFTVSDGSSTEVSLFCRVGHVLVSLRMHWATLLRRGKILWRCL